jgi:hypothetical protein
MEPRRAPGFPLNPPPTSTYTSTHPAAPIRAQAASATDLTSINAFLAWVTAFLAWTDVNQAWPNVFLARPNAFLGWGNGFRRSTHRPEASLEANQISIVAGEL